MRRILVTGASTWVGGHVIRQLERRDDVDVCAVDELDPLVEFTTPIQKLALDHLEFAEFFLKFQPHVLMHLQTVDRAAEIGRTRSYSRVVVGGQALFGALERCTTTEQVILKSDGAFYGAGPRHPSVVSETTRLRPPARTYPRSIRNLEDLTMEVAADLGGITFTVLRFAPIIGPTIGNTMSRYLRLPLVPTLLGSDPRLQFVYETDAVEAVLRTVDNPVRGQFNIAAAGQLYLSRVLRLGRRISQPLPPPQYRSVVKNLRVVGGSLPPHSQDLLRYGRIMDTAAMRSELAWEPSATSRQAVMAMYDRVTIESPS